MDSEANISKLSKRPYSSYRPVTAKINKASDSEKFDVFKISEIEEVINYKVSEVKEEITAFDFLKKQTKKLDNIELLEKNSEDLFKWNSILNPKSNRPKTSKNFSKKQIFQEKIAEKNKNYEHFSKNQSNVNEVYQKQVDNNQTINVDYSKSFVFPIALIDEKEEKLNDYITIQNERKRKKRINRANAVSARQNTKKDVKKLSSNYSSINDQYRETVNSVASKSSNKVNDRKGNSTRPQSVFSKRNDNDIFYTNKAVNDYFTQDFKQFAWKFKPLQAKLPVKNNKIKKALNQEKKNHVIATSLLSSRPKIEKLFDDRDLKITLNSGRIEPLIKSMASCTENENWSEFISAVHNKSYLKSNKPLGNWDGKVDYRVNIRNKLMVELKESVMKDQNENKLITEEYKDNDPDVKIFSDYQSKEENNLLTDNDRNNSIENNLLSQKLEKTNSRINEENKSSFLNNLEIDSSLYHKFINTTTNTKELVKDLNSVNKISENDVEKIDELSETSKISQNVNTKETKDQIKTTNYNVITTKTTQVQNNKSLSSNYNNTIPSNINKKTERPITAHHRLQGILNVENINNSIKNSLSSTEKIPSSSRPRTGIVKTSTSKGIQTNKNYKRPSAEKLRPITAKVINKNDLNTIMNKTNSCNIVDSELVTDDLYDNYKSTKINNMYFNEFIDLKFRPNNQNFGRFLNSYKKDDLSLALRNRNHEATSKIVHEIKPLIVKQRQDFSDLLQVESYKQSDYTLRSKPRSAISKPNPKK